MAAIGKNTILGIAHTLVLTGLIFIQLVIFHYLCYESVLISALWKDPVTFWTFYTPKIGVSLVCASLLSFFKNRIWSLFFMAVWGIVSLATLVYFRSTAVIWDINNLSMMGNLDGFWSSVFVYLHPVDCLLFLPCLILGGSLLIPKPATHSLIVSLSCFVIGACTCLYANSMVLGYAIDSPKSERLSFRLIWLDSQSIDNCFSSQNDMCCRQWSLMHHTAHQFLKLFDNEETVISPSAEIMQPFINDRPLKKTPNSGLVICLIESLESWVVSPEITPNLWSFAHSSHTLYADKIKPQVKGGMSADGQMIVETGLLPIKSGAACFKCPTSIYPSLNELYVEDSTIAVIPHDLGVWNQALMNKAYKYGNAITVSSSDKMIFRTVVESTRMCQSILALTISTHSPFTNYADSSSLSLPEGMPADMSNYMKSINYMDEGLGILIAAIMEDSIMASYTVVITGDHAVFDNTSRSVFSHYCQEKGLQYHVNSAVCPCVIYSPRIESHLDVNDEAYQMNIYPTILDILDADSYWKGFGVSLLAPNFNSMRIIDENRAYDLSDCALRSDYFSQLN